MRLMNLPFDLFNTATFIMQEVKKYSVGVATSSI
jgi:hypothetical protein